MGFIDNNCAIFVNDEENKFEYSNTHRDFVATVEDIIDEQLGRIGITVDQFVVACEKARNSRDINREVSVGTRYSSLHLAAGLRANGGYG
tara:strand:- start:2117 stop:2386 length:270 start_codon:yes stop_codon:yes gene_type:complete